MKWRDEGPFVSVSPIPRSHPSIRVREEREKKGKRHIVLFNRHSAHTYLDGTAVLLPRKKAQTLLLLSVMSATDVMIS